MKIDKINYNGGEIWVNREAKIKVGDTYVLIATDGIDEPTYLIRVLESNYKPFGFKVVAQSITNPSYIDGVPFVEVEEDCIMLSKQYAETNYGHTVETKGAVARGFVKGYKAAQAKQFTEEDIRKAFKAGEELGTNTTLFNCTDRISRHEYESTPDEDTYIDSLKPKVDSIEIEMELCEETCNHGRCVTHGCMNPINGDIPVTYQKDGKIFLKVKKINYESTVK